MDALRAFAPLSTRWESLPAPRRRDSGGPLTDRTNAGGHGDTIEAAGNRHGRKLPTSRRLPFSRRRPTPQAPSPPPQAQPLPEPRPRARSPPQPRPHADKPEQETMQAVPAAAVKPPSLPLSAAGAATSRKCGMLASPVVPAGVATDVDGIAPVFATQRRRRAVFGGRRGQGRPPPTPPLPSGTAPTPAGIADIFPRPVGRSGAAAPSASSVAAVAHQVAQVRAAHVALRHDADSRFKQWQSLVLDEATRAITARCHHVQLHAELAEQRHLRAEAALAQALKRAEAAKAQHALVVAQLEDLEGEAATLRATARNMRDTLQDITGTVRVVARVRPALAMDRRLRVGGSSDSSAAGAAGLHYMGKTDGGMHEGVVVLPPRRAAGAPASDKDIAAGHLFHFDRVFKPGATQSDVFEELEPLLRAALKGKNVCIFAYGATGSGKTFTMDAAHDVDGPSHDAASLGAGIIPRTIQYLLTAMGSQAARRPFTVHMAGYEVYNDTVRDVMTGGSGPRHAPGPAAVKGDLSNLRHAEVRTMADAGALLARIRRHRAVATTKCNDRSSRSHCVVRLLLRRRDGPSVGGVGSGGRSSGSTLARRVAAARPDTVVNLVDLAGSERVAHSGVKGVGLTEACHVNKSLTALGSVVSAIAKGRKHVPYRDSKLTRVLKPCLDGGSKTLMVCAAADTAAHSATNLQAFRFGATVSGCAVSKRATVAQARASHSAASHDGDAETSAVSTSR